MKKNRKLLKSIPRIALTMNKTFQFVLQRIIDGLDSRKPIEGVEFKLNQAKTYTCGRSQNNDIICHSESVSRNHCSFICNTDEIYLQDLSSGNGVYVNAKKLKRQELIKLKQDDIIGIGVPEQHAADLDKFIYQLKKQSIVNNDKNQRSKSLKRKCEREKTYRSSKSKPKITDEDFADYLNNETVDNVEIAATISNAYQEVLKEVTSSVDKRDVAKDQNQETTISADKENCVLENHSEEVPLNPETICSDNNRIDEMVSHIITWNPDDFLICNNLDLNLEPMLKKYDTFEQYKKVLMSYLIFDVAKKIESAKKTLFNRIEECTVVKDSAIKTMISGTNVSVLEFDICIKVLNESDFKAPTIGDLLLLEIGKLVGKSAMSLFAFTKNVTMIQTEANPNQINCSMLTKFVDLNISSSEIKNLQIITSLNLERNLLEGLREFKSSPLSPLIINPELCLTDSNDFFPNTRVKSQFKQSNAIQRIAKTVSSEEPKVCLIEGPPGTGKTTIILETIAKILCIGEVDTQCPQKILVCAKTEVEVDEIVIKLSSLAKLVDPGRAIKMIRFCDSESTIEQANYFSFQRLAEQHVKLGVREFSLSEERLIRGELDYQEQMMIVTTTFMGLVHPSILTKAKILETCFRLQNTGKNVDEIAQKLIKLSEKTLLSEANVIVSTLSMCASTHEMNSAFRKKEDIAICFIDNALQISEIEILKPLAFGVKTLVLLGDPYENSFTENGEWDFETVRLENTLFSRLKESFVGKGNSPLISLDFQYRTNKIVMNRLNKIYYDGNIKLGISQVKFPLYACRAFNLWTHRTDADDALFVAKLILCILQFTDFKNAQKPLSIGVIVPLNNLIPGIKSEIKKRLSSSMVDNGDWFKIDVDTISGFKNQEKDVIIMSCTKRINDVEESVKDEYLYRAITRVKYALILFGSLKKLIPGSVLESLLVHSSNKQRRFFNLNDNISPLELKQYIIKRYNRKTV